MNMQHSWITEKRRQTWNTIYSYTEQHITKGDGKDEFGNLPYPLAAFGDLLDEVDRYDEANGNEVATKLLDIGCGSGQLVAIAAEFFGMRACGFDNDLKSVEAADELFWKLMPQGMYMSAWQQDADSFNFHDLARYDIVVLNRLFVGPVRQRELETNVFDYISPGSYMVKLNNVSVPEDGTFICSNALGGSVVRKS
jgi:SAM-dependent methyltransferase